MENEVSTPPKPDSEESLEWKRSKWLTGWLWFMLITNLINMFAVYLTAEQVMESSPNITMPIIYMLAFGSMLFCIFIVLIMQNKKIGYYCLVIAALLVFVFNIYVVGVKAAIIGTIGFVILSILIFKGGKDSAWANFS